jgi:3'-phosphoadenosine 5'-phosphosulfate synthase
VAKGTRVNMPVPIVLPINDAAKKRIGDAKRVVLVSPAGVELAVL